MSQTNFWGELISQLMKEQGVSSRKLSAQTGVHRTTLRRFIQGKPTQLSIVKLECLLEALEYELDAIPKKEAMPCQ